MSFNIRQIKLFLSERSNTLNHLEGGKLLTINRSETLYALERQYEM